MRNTLSSRVTVFATNGSSLSSHNAKTFVTGIRRPAETIAAPKPCRQGQAPPCGRRHCESDVGCLRSFTHHHDDMRRRAMAPAPSKPANSMAQLLGSGTLGSGTLGPGTLGPGTGAVVEAESGPLGVRLNFAAAEPSRSRN